MRTTFLRLTSGLIVAAGAWVGAASVMGQASGPAQPQPVAGDVVPPFSAEALDGSRRVVDYPKGSTTVLIFFLSGCPTCHRMIPEWNRAWDRRPKGLTVIGVLLDREPPGFFSVTPVAFPIVRSPGREFLNQCKVHRVPVTMRLGAGGRVQDVSVGTVDPIRLGELFRPPS